MTVPTDHRPTDLELDILHVIWSHRKATVRQVMDGLLPERELALTTVTTLLNRMVEKGWLKRSKQGPGRFVYTPVLSETRTKRTLLRGFLHRLFPGSSQGMLVQNIFNSDKLDKDELDALSEMIDKAKRRKK